MVTGAIPALWLDLQVLNQHGRPANPHSVAGIFRVRATALVAPQIARRRYMRMEMLHVLRKQ